MAFWNEKTFEPLRQFRWTVVFGSTATTDAKLDNVAFALKKISRPKVKIGEITHKYLNHSFYYPGRAEWEAVNMTFAGVAVDSNEGPGSTRTLLTALANAGYTIPGRYGEGKKAQTLSKNGFQSAIGNMMIRNIRADGVAIEGFVLHNPFFTSLEFGELDYGSDEVVDLTATVRYDYATFSLDPSGKEVEGTAGVTIV